MAFPVWLQWVVGVIVGLIVLLLLVKVVMYFCIYKWNQFTGEMKDKVVLVTGGTSGIGEVCVRDLYLRGATVIFTGRNGNVVREQIVPNLAKSLKTKVQKVTSGGSDYKALDKEEVKTLLQDAESGQWDEKGNYSSKYLHFRKVDQADLTDVVTFCTWVKEKFERVDIILNNAGGVANTYKLSAQGIEWTIGVNHLAHYLMAELLFDTIAAQGRVVNVSSMAHRQVDNKAGLKPDWNLYFAPEKDHYKFWNAYCYSKLANVYFADCLDIIARKANKDLKTASLHPGVIRSNFFNRAGALLSCLEKMTYPIWWAIFMSVDQGAQTSLHAVSIPYEQLKSRAYLSNCKEAQKNLSISTEGNYEQFVKTSTEMCEKATGIKFKYLIWDPSN